MSLPPLLDELLRAAGPPGREDAVKAIARREAAAGGAEVEADSLGSTVALVRGTDGGRLLALFAHADQVGLAVRDAEESGLVTVAPLGSWKPAAAVGQRLAVLVRETRVPAVATRRGEGEVSWDDVRLDIGAASRAEALALVAPGDPAVLVSPPLELAGGRLAAGALDNRVGVFAALELLRRFAAAPPSWDVAVVISTQEETAPRTGAAAAAVAARLQPEVAVVLEATYAADAPGGEPAWGDVRLGAGPAIFRGTVVHPDVAERLLAAAAREGIGVAVETGEETWSDADALFTAAGGIATGLVSVPLRYMHSAVEVAQLSDIEDAVRLVEAFVRSLEPGASFLR